MKMRKFIILPCLLSLSLLAQEQSVKPGINEKFLDPKLNVTEWTDRWETESREIYHQREQIIAAVGLNPKSEVRRRF